MTLATVIAFERLNVRSALFVTAPVPSEPVAPPPPMLRDPAEIVVVPEYVLAPVSVAVPPPIWVRAPVPVIAPPTVIASERLNARVALLVMLPVIEPEVPPLPICRVPAEMVVVPV